MSQAEDVVVGMLLSRWKAVAPDRVKKCRAQATARGVAAADQAAQDGLATAEEAHGLRETARFLSTGQHLRVCAACLTQVVAPAGAASCPRCAKPLQRGVLPSPQTVVFDPGLERHVRGIFAEAAAAVRAQAQVDEARRLREEGKIGRRPEAELAPKDKSCGESMLGPYQLHALVGRGASSYVYRAEDTRDGQTIALKVLYVAPDEPADKVAEKFARFRREAELASSLDHPNLVRTGPLEQTGSWYHIAMTFVDGPTLGQLLEVRGAAAAAGSAPVAGTDLQALAAGVAEVARGLHFAHCRGIVHRDVNPRNILFSSAGQPHLSDFGVARPIEVGSTLTAANTVLGTLGYVAPERLESESKADARSDVFSLGVVLYEVLTGRLPWSGANPMLLLTKITKERPAPPGSLNPAVSPALEAAALRALEPDPARRFASALDFAHAVAEALVEDDGAATSATAPAGGSAPIGAGAAGSRGEAATAGTGRPLRAAAIAFAAGVVICAIGVAGILPMSPEPASHLRRAEERQTRLSTSRSAVEYAEGREEVAEALAEAERGVPASDARLRLARGRLAWAQGDLGAALAALEGGVPDGALGAELLRLRGLSAYFLGQRWGSGPEGEAARKAAQGAFAELSRGTMGTWDGKFAEAALLLIGRDLDGAYGRFHTLAREQVGRPEPALMVAWVALHGGASGTAAAGLQPLATAIPYDPVIQVARALALLQEEKPEPALTLARAVRKLWPPMAEAALVEGAALLARGDPVRARAALAAALRIDPVFPEACRVLAETHAAQDDPCGEIHELSRALDANPDAQELFFLRAVARYGHVGQSAQAEAELRQYLQKYPNGPHAEEAKYFLGEDWED